MRAKIRADFALVLQTLTTEDVLLIHEALAADFAAADDPIAPAGVRDMGLLESAIGRQFAGSVTSLKYPAPIENAATVMYGICSNHPFHNGNKRTALVSLLSHLDKNGLTLMDTREKE